ncbi:MAG: shikimate dehydrogenase [Anaerolineales bacterium]|nr:shikimate dehydrogenase [Anaerolineales bacterium]
MIHLGLIGYPLGHSLSPIIHAAALRDCGLQGDYSLFSVHPDDRQGLKDLLDRVRSGEITGLNVTIPHKQNVLELTDELTSTAQAIGAVNTIYMRENKLIGDNTDAPGFLADLRQFLSGDQLPSENHKSSIVLGAGGSARAIVYALVNDGWDVTIAARRPEQAQEVASQYEKISAIELNLHIFQLESFNLIVNTTPLGMTPNIDQSPLPENLSLPQHVAIYDLVYNPRETKLVNDACAKGLKATTGFGMLIEQAALSFELWTGKSPSRDVLWNAVND